MAMHNPPHPGEFIQATYMEPYNLTHKSSLRSALSTN